MRTKTRRPLATTALLVCACAMFAGCGDEGDHLPAGMTGSSTVLASGGDGILDGDPGQLDASLASGIDDPVLQDAVLDEDFSGDPWSTAVADWDEHEGSTATAFSTGGLDDVAFDDDFAPVGYGYGRGYDDGWGIGNGVLAAAGYGGLGGFGGFGSAGFVDPGFEDPGAIDPGFDDPGVVDPGFDAAFADPGAIDAGVADVGFADPGLVDPGFADAGFDAGAVDVGAVDPGIVF